MSGELWLLAGIYAFVIVAYVVGTYFERRCVADTREYREEMDRQHAARVAEINKWIEQTEGKR